MMKTKVFVSRYLAEESPLLAYLRSEQIEFQAESLIAFTDVSFDLPLTDWLFFYSKKGVQHFLNQAALKDLESYHIACYGGGTSRYFESVTDRTADFVGTGISDTTLAPLLDAIGDDSIAFVHGQRSVRAVEKKLPNHINHSSVVVYDNQQRTDVALSHYDIALMTSPMNYRAFIANGGSTDHIIAIGPTTAAAIEQHNLQKSIEIKSLHSAHSPSEAAMLNLLKSLIWQT